MAGVLEAARTAGPPTTTASATSWTPSRLRGGRRILLGRRGTVGGVCRAVHFQVNNYGLTFIGVTPYWQQIIKGIIIASAVALDIRKYMNKK